MPNNAQPGTFGPLGAPRPPTPSLGNYDGAAAAAMAGPATTPNYSGAAAAAGLPQPGQTPQHLEGVPMGGPSGKRPPFSQGFTMGNVPGGWGSPQLGGWGASPMLGRWGGQYPQNPQFGRYQSIPTAEDAATTGPNPPPPRNSIPNPGRPNQQFLQPGSPWQGPWMGGNGRYQPWTENTRIGGQMPFTPPGGTYPLPVMGGGQYMGGGMGTMDLGSTSNQANYW